VVSFQPARLPHHHPIPLVSNDTVVAFQDALDKNDIFFDDPNIDTSSVTTDGTCLAPSLHDDGSQTSLNLPEWEDESPYPEVRAAVSNTDDMEMPVDTFRAWTIGLFWAIIIPGLNQFLYFRYPSITVGSVRCALHLVSMWSPPPS
jgi:hypothetical protein